MLALAAVTLSVSCAGSRQAGYVRDYQAGRHAAAYRAARAAAVTETGADREEAALIAGLAAQALGDDRAAEEWLSPLRSSRNRSIAGRARAGLGLLAAERGEHERAAALLSAASLMLRGDDAARAAYHAGESLRALGHDDEARREYRRAATVAHDDVLRRAATGRLSGRGYTVQLGAFKSRRNADRARREATAAAVGLGFGSPRIVVSQRHGRAVYLVQVGEFATSEAAQRARERLGLDSIVASAPDE